MRVRLDTQEITTLTTQSSQEQLALSTKFMATIAGVDERIARVEKMLLAQSLQLQANQFAQVGSTYTRRKRVPSPRHETATAPAQATGGIGVRVRPYVVTWHTGCLCACHSQKRSSTPAILNSLLGRLFIAYAGRPVLSPECDNQECRRSRASKISMEYWSPTSLWSTIVRSRWDTIQMPVLGCSSKH